MTPDAKADAAGAPLRPLERMGVPELEVLRLLLRGGSVIDWRRLEYSAPEEVTRFLSLNLFDLDDAKDEQRLRNILAQAVEYLRTEFGYRVVPAVAAPGRGRAPFLFASGRPRPGRPP